MADDKREQAIDAETFNKLRSHEKWSHWFANKKAYKGRFSCRYCGNKSDPERCPPFPGHTMHCGNCEMELSRRTGGGQGDPFGWVLDAPTITKATAEGIPQLWVDVADRLPPAKEGWNHSEQCLVWYQPSLDAVGNYGIAYYHYDPPYRPCEWVDFAHLGRDPIAWQPLPAPYQRKSEGDSE